MNFAIDRTSFPDRFHDCIAARRRISEVVFFRKATQGHGRRKAREAE